MHRLRASLWKAGYALTGRNDGGRKYYQSTLDAEFSAGYREARTGVAQRTGLRTGPQH
jgi:hypothetical protein